MKRVWYILLVALFAGSWVLFLNKSHQLDRLAAEVKAEQNKGDPEGRVGAMEQKVHSLEGDRTIYGILLTFVSAGLGGTILVVYLLPFFAQKLTHAVYDSGEMVERDAMHDARSLFAQGDYHGAIEAYKQAAALEPTNRFPWVEIVKIYQQNLHDPASAIETIRHVLASQEWDVDNAAYFLFRLAEMYEIHEGNREMAKAIMEQVVNDFAGTRHSANASHKLHEWGVQESMAVAEATAAAHGAMDVVRHDEGEAPPEENA